jgi:acyl carrier protein
MGLDFVEFAMCVEDGFGLHIPDSVWSQLRTPGKLIDHLVSSLPQSSEGESLSQRAFDRLRQAVRQHSPQPVPDLHPDTSLVDLWAPKDRDRVWSAIGAELGARRWPRLAWTGSMRVFDYGRMRNTADVVRHLVERTPVELKAPGEGWTRDQIAEVVRELIRDELGIQPESYAESSHWVEDMGVD